jgi:hypothetical protein
MIKKEKEDKNHLRKIIFLYSKSLAKHLNTLCVQNAQFLKVTAAGT